MLICFLLAYNRGAVPVVIRPPAIAKLDGITVGLTTVEQFERRYGKGSVHMGGHSNSGRGWYDNAEHIFLDCDGFNFSKNGEVIDTLNADWEPEGTVNKQVPRVHVSKRDLGILSKLHEGMSVLEVESTLKIKLTSAQIKDHDWVTFKGLIKYSSRPVNAQSDQIRDWNAVIEFGPKGLVGLEVVAD